MYSVLCSHETVAAIGTVSALGHAQAHLNACYARFPVRHVGFYAVEPMHAKGVEGEALRSEERRAHALKRMSKGLARNRESQRVHKKNLSSGMQSAHRATRCAGTTLTTDWWRYLNSRYNATM